MSIFKLIGRNVKALRKDKGMTQEQLSLEIDMSAPHLRAIEHGRTNPTVKTLERIAKALDEPIIKLLNNSEDDYE